MREILPGPVYFAVMAKKRRTDSWFVYMLECESGAVYTGVAVDVAARYVRHCSGKGAKYTRANPPRRILAVKRCAGRSAALKAEAALKQLERADKLAWAARRAHRYKEPRTSRALE
jgi:putative endonuclease